METGNCKLEQPVVANGVNKFFDTDGVNKTNGRQIKVKTQYFYYLFIGKHGYRHSNTFFFLFAT